MRPDETDNGDDDEKLIPEWGVRADDQILWIGLAVFAALLLAFGWNRWQSDDGSDGVSIAPVVEEAGRASGLDEVVSTVAGAVAAPVTEAPASTTTTAPTTTASSTTQTTLPPGPAIGDVEAAVAPLPGQIDATIDGNDVTLTGFVATAAEEAEAIRAAEAVDGVDTVTSELVILVPQVEAVLADQGVAQAGVEGLGTVMTVTGALQSEADRAPTLAAAGDIDGVTDVVDQLTVSVAEALNELDTIPFATGSARILPEGQPIVAEAARLIADAGDVSLRVEGYTDIRGDAEVNQELSEARAAAVVAALVAAGIDEAQLTPQGFGPTEQFGAGTSPEALAANRVVRFVQT